MDARLTHLRRTAGPYIVALVAVAAALALRLLLQPWLGETHAYAAFYPVVFLAAYALGRRVATVAAGAAGVAGLLASLWLQPGQGLGPEALAPLAFFSVTAAAGVWLISTLTSALDRLAAEQSRFRAIADAHAELFTELQSRIGHHLQLIAGAIALRSGKADPQAIELLRRVGERSQLIARVHRELAEQAPPDVDFAAFAGALARAACQDAGLPPDRVKIDGAVRLPQDVATSLGVALVECLLWILKRKPGGAVRIQLEAGPSEAKLRIRHDGDVVGAEMLRLAPAADLFRAMAEQLGAGVVMAMSDTGGPAVEISLPLDTPGPVLTTTGSAATLH